MAIFCIGISKRLKVRLRVIMDKALKICFLAKRGDTNYDLQIRGKVLPLHIHRKINNLILMRYKKQIRSTLKTEPLRETRSKDVSHVKCDFPKTGSSRQSISYSALRYWELLPGRLKRIGDPDLFKSVLKTTRKNCLSKMVLPDNLYD